MELPVSKSVTGSGSYLISEEERVRRSEQAKRLVAEGKLGGRRGRAGRPSKLRTKLAVTVVNDPNSRLETEFHRSLTYTERVFRIMNSTAHHGIDVHVKVGILRK